MHRNGPLPQVTDQDRKLVRPMRTETAVRSTVHHNLKFVRTDEKPVFRSINLDVGSPKH